MFKKIFLILIVFLILFNFVFVFTVQAFAVSSAIAIIGKILLAGGATYTAVELVKAFNNLTYNTNAVSTFNSNGGISYNLARAFQNGFYANTQYKNRIDEFMESYKNSFLATQSISTTNNLDIVNNVVNFNKIKTNNLDNNNIEFTKNYKDNKNSSKNIFLLKNYPLGNYYVNLRFDPDINTNTLKTDILLSIYTANNLDKNLSYASAYKYFNVDLPINKLGEDFIRRFNYSKKNIYKFKLSLNDNFLNINLDFLEQDYNELNFTTDFKLDISYFKEYIGLDNIITSKKDTFIPYIPKNLELNKPVEQIYTDYVSIPLDTYLEQIKALEGNPADIPISYPWEMQDGIAIPSPGYVYPEEKIKEKDKENTAGIGIGIGELENTLDRSLEKSGTKTLEKALENSKIKEKEKNKIDFKPFKNLKIKEKFPFSLPWDFARILESFKDNNNTAPKFIVNFLGNNLELDFAIFNPIANTLKILINISYIFLLIFLTNKFLGSK